jgi:hypothetical protein
MRYCCHHRNPKRKRRELPQWPARRWPGGFHIRLSGSGDNRLANGYDVIIRPVL